MSTQTTIQKEISLSGVGIHSGKQPHVTLSPAKPDTGILFIRSDQNIQIPATISHVTHTTRATTLTHDGVAIQTPEHLLAAAYGMGIDNLIVTIDTEEVPILDGSAQPFVEAILNAGIQTLNTPRTPITISSPQSIIDKDQTISIIPSDHLQITYILDLSHVFVGIQTVSVIITPDSFQTEIAPARTWGFESEVQALLEQNLAKGGHLENALIIGKESYLNTPRMTHELALHKCLDILGDLALLGLKRPITGHVIGFRSGHFLNTQLANLLLN